MDGQPKTFCASFGFIVQPLLSVQSLRERKQVSKAVKSLVRERDMGRCQHCGIEVSAVNEAFDHFIPVAFGGASTAENLLGRVTTAIEKSGISRLGIFTVRNGKIGRLGKLGGDC